MHRRDGVKPVPEAEWNQHRNALGSVGPDHVSVYQLLMINRHDVGLGCPPWGQCHLLSLEPHPQLLFFMCGERLSAGDWAQSLSIVGFAGTYLSAGCHNGYMLFYLQVIKQL